MQCVTADYKPHTCQLKVDHPRMCIQLCLSILFLTAVTLTLTQ